MPKLERKVGRSCIKGVFLDELDPKRGRSTKEVMPDCNLICNLEFTDILDNRVDEIYNGHQSIYSVN